MRPELIVAEKEFRDHLSSKRFLVILAILLLLSCYGVYTGMQSYDSQLNDYKNPQYAGGEQGMQQQAAMLQQEIKDAQAQNASQERIQSLQYSLDSITNRPMPSLLIVFNSMVMLFTFLGMILGIALGFDQISKERDDGSLKFLASSPIYRDAIINGKAIGAISTLAVAMGSAFLFAIAIVMLMGVVPGLNDMIRIVAFFITALLYCSVFFAIALLASTVTKSTSTSILCMVGIVLGLVIFSVLSFLVAGLIAQAIMGPAPTYNPPTIIQNVNDTMSGQMISYGSPSSDYTNYYNKLTSMEVQISDAITVVSPINDFGGGMGIGITPGLGSAMLSKTQYAQTFYISSMPGTAKEVSLLDSLASVWIQLLALIVELVVAFGISYAVFMRMDIR